MSLVRIVPANAGPYVVAPRATVVRFITLRSTVARPGLAARGMRVTRRLPSRCAPEAPPPPPDVLPPPPDASLPPPPDASLPPPPDASLPPPPDARESPSWIPWWPKVWGEVKRNCFHLGIMAFCIGVGYLATKENPEAAYLVTMCDKVEKLYKLLSRLVPVFTAILKCFK
ncbi:glyceraldehyde-3-phosphate dehydrogenase, testis-specific isoform X1 [Triticum aestivum]|uniref:glyceraldehyde-3-phosphate dehydrogenase, testis-specific isoform X1 n=1 Tax=Triticum aestivum TaxID=4565 RepID=UPI001D034B5A|nr:glyceraldehyde-3-phosphate dehydrogenase, testis-specific-like isoform X1 [Triticum aestivum]